MSKGLTLEKAGERYGVSRRTWSRYEKGMNLSVRSLRRIAKVLGVKVRNLLDD